MEFEITLTRDHWKRFQQLLMEQVKSKIKTPFGSPWGAMLMWAGVGFCLVFGVGLVDSFDGPTAIFVLTAVMVWRLITALSVRAWEKVMQPWEEGAFLGVHRFKISEEGMKVQSEHCNAFYDWSAFQNVQREDELFLLYIDNASALVLPEDQLENPDELFVYISRKLQDTSRLFRAKPSEFPE